MCLEPGDILGQLQPVTLVEDVGRVAEKLSDVVVAGIYNEDTSQEKKFLVKRKKNVVKVHVVSRSHEKHAF